MLGASLSLVKFKEVPGLSSYVIWCIYMHQELLVSKESEGGERMEREREGRGFIDWRKLCLGDLLDFGYTPWKWMASSGASSLIFIGRGKEAVETR